MHEPTVSETAPDEWMVFCSCGWDSGPWETDEAAMMAWELDHEW